MLTPSPAWSPDQLGLNIYLAGIHVFIHSLAHNPPKRLTSAANFSLVDRKPRLLPGGHTVVDQRADGSTEGDRAMIKELRWAQRCLPQVSTTARPIGMTANAHLHGHIWPSTADFPPPRVKTVAAKERGNFLGVVIDIYKRWTTWQLLPLVAGRSTGHNSLPLHVSRWIIGHSLAHSLHTDVQVVIFIWSFWF